MGSKVEAFSVHHPRGSHVAKPLLWTNLACFTSFYGLGRLLQMPLGLIIVITLTLSRLFRYHPQASYASPTPQP